MKSDLGFEVEEMELEEKLPNRFIAIATLKNQMTSFSTKKLIEIIKE